MDVFEHSPFFLELASLELVLLAFVLGQASACVGALPLFVVSVAWSTGILGSENLILEYACNYMDRFWGYCQQPSVWSFLLQPRIGDQPGGLIYEFQSLIGAGAALLTVIEMRRQSLRGEAALKAQIAELRLQHIQNLAIASIDKIALVQRVSASSISDSILAKAGTLKGVYLSFENDPKSEFLDRAELSGVYTQEVEIPCCNLIQQLNTKDWFEVCQLLAGDFPRRHDVLCSMLTPVSSHSFFAGIEKDTGTKVIARMVKDALKCAAKTGAELESFIADVLKESAPYRRLANSLLPLTSDKPAL